MYGFSGNSTHESTASAMRAAPSATTATAMSSADFATVVLRLIRLRVRRFELREMKAAAA